MWYQHLSDHKEVQYNSKSDTPDKSGHPALAESVINQSAVPGSSSTCHSDVGNFSPVYLEQRFALFSVPVDVYTVYVTTLTVGILNYLRSLFVQHHI